MQRNPCTYSIRSGGIVSKVGATNRELNGNFSNALDHRVAAYVAPAWEYGEGPVPVVVSTGANGP
jgi:hypothetical protein